MGTFTEAYLEETRRIVAAIDAESVERLAEGLATVRERSGRLFILGVGGSAGHASHAVNDFRKLCGIEAYTPVDNTSELTARINDEGWDTSFSAWLAGSHLSARDGVLVFSVGGGDRERGISTNIVSALDSARAAGCFIGGIVGRDGGHTGRVADAVVLIPPLVDARVTAHTEGLCAVVWHLLVSHPRLQRAATKWESAVGNTASPGSHLIDPGP
jgi:D-sedoheptulose 7-phosphate isomerase